MAAEREASREASQARLAHPDGDQSSLSILCVTVCPRLSRSGSSLVRRSAKRRAHRPDYFYPKVGGVERCALSPIV